MSIFRVYHGHLLNWINIMEVESTINLQTLYILCRSTIYNHPETYAASLNSMNIVASWINTIDSLDVSLMACDTMKVIDEITSANEIARYISILTEITIILNNIFYSAEKPYKRFWKENSNLLYNQLVYPVIAYDNNNDIKQFNVTMDVDEYYHSFFLIFQEKCIKSGLTIDLDEYTL